nr:PREDICTED: kinesin-like protein KIF12 isoform X2 [Latimeria chalumnae]|eukprot:XP_014353194.1 PREDICTED: kinesin-like protein KIF12 isoform X2 [Latimeria chalumnae]
MLNLSFKVCNIWSSLQMEISESANDDREIKESGITVAIRVRPLNSTETSRRDYAVVNCPGKDSIIVNNGSQGKVFNFDMVFDPNSSQHEVFEYCGIKRLIDLSQEGFSCTIFAFGQTGSGKTYTITGPITPFEKSLKNQPFQGLLQRTFVYLLNSIQARNTDTVLSASYLEIYNEQVKDLLNPRLSDSLPVRWSKTRGFYVENLFTVQFETLESIMNVLAEGTRNRQSSSHTLNEYSSRSHTLLTIYIKTETTHPNNLSRCLTKHGKLCFVDLAGSERVKETGSTGELMTEANNINRSLLTLGNCISALVDPKKKDGYIPYRDSKLTKLLADCLGGSGITLMFACVSPSSTSLQETMNTLRYASRAKRIKNRPVAKMDQKEKLIIGLEEEIKALQMENLFLRQQLQLPSAGKKNQAVKRSKAEGLTKICGMDAIETGFLQGESVEAEETLSRLQPFPEQSLYGMLQEFMIENENLRCENNRLLKRQESSREEQQLLSEENGRLVQKLVFLERVISSSPSTCSNSLSEGSEGSTSSYESCCTLPLPSLPTGSYGLTPYRQSNSHPLWFPISIPVIIPSKHVPTTIFQSKEPMEAVGEVRQQKWKQLKELPPLKMFVPQRCSQQQQWRPAQQPTRQHNADPLLLRRKKSLRDGSYASRYQMMKEAREHSRDSSQHSPEKVLPSAPLMPSPHHPGSKGDIPPANSPCSKGDLPMDKLAEELYTEQPC